MASTSRNSSTLGRRLGVVRATVLIGAALLVVQLVNLQVVRASHFQHLSTSQLRQDVKVPALRGPIYDRDGQVLAMSIPTKMVVADDFQISHPDVEAQALSPLVGIPATTLVEKLSQRNGYVVLATHVDLGSAATLAKDALPGITLFDSSQRSSPDGSLAETVVGGTHSDGAGAAGLEYQYDRLLAGESGDEEVFESPYGVSLPTSHVTVLHRAVPGTGLELTLDAPLQFVTEQALGSELVASNALSGTAIVLDTHTGQILSMASLVNTNEQDSALPSPPVWPTSTGIPGVDEALNNLAVTQTYEPGSVFKIVPFSAALLAGLITPSSHFSIPDQVLLDGHVFHDAEQHGLLNYTATQILEYSSNIGTYEIARELGESGLLAGVQRLGFGQPTGLGFPGESTGLLMNANGFSPTDVAALPIGQEDAVTPLQVLDAYNIIANGGTFVAPSLVRGSIAIDGTIKRAAASATRSALTPTVAAELNAMLVQVVRGGTGTLAAVPGYTIAGKTGTAQIPYPDRSAYITGAYNATFVGFAPAQHPVLSMIVVIQRPTPLIYGGSVAAPVFARVMAYALHRYGVPATGGTRLSRGPASFLQDVT